MSASLSKIKRGDIPLSNVITRPQPIFLLLDMSGSMAGWKNASIAAAIARFSDWTAMGSDPHAPRLLSIITFNSYAEVVVPLQDVSQLIEVPRLLPGGGTILGPAFELLARELSDDTLVPFYAREPLVVLLIDGEPSDNWRPHFELFDRRFGHRSARLSVALGESGLVHVTSVFANLPVLALADPTDANELDSLFRWLGGTLVVSIDDQAVDLSVNPPKALHASRLVKSGTA